MKALAVIKPNVLQLVDVPMPRIGPYDALVRTELNFICNATDRKLIEGHFPGVDASGYPLLLGHENTGIVTEVGDRVTTFTPGDRVVCGLFLHPEPPFKSNWGGCGEYVVAHDHAAMVADGVADAEHGWSELYQIMRKVPADIPPEAAALLCTWREVYSAFTAFKLKPEDRILIFGVGPVGLSFINFAKIMGFRFVACVAPRSPKHDVAKRLGVDAIYTPDEDYAARFLADAGGPADAVIDAVGSPDIINRSLGMLRMEGTVGVYGVVSDSSMTLDLERAPLNFNLLFHREPTRVHETGATDPVCRLVREGRLRPDDYITGRFAIDDYAAAFAATREKRSIKTLLAFTHEI